MMWSVVFAAAALLCGIAAGLATNRLLKERARDASALQGWPAAQAPLLWHRSDPAALPGVALPRPLLLLTPPLLGVASLALSLTPGLEDPRALSQALLLLYVLVPLALVDLATLTIEPALVLGGIGLRLAVVFGVQRTQAIDMLGGMLSGAGLLAMVGFAYQWLRGREGLGEGDAAVLGLIGAFVGWRGILPVVLLGTALGLVAGVPLLLLTRKPLHTPLPFAPFLCAAGLSVYLLQVQGWSLFGLLPALP